MSRCRPRVGHPSVAGDDWQTLDFGDIEEELAAKLTDDDISKVLLHIDAANKVKRLRLTNMVNITGAGSSPLIGCTSIEQIDLSLVGAHRLPQLDLSCKLVCPILHSIVSQENSALKHIMFPHSWRRKDARVFQYYNGSKEYARNFRFHEFLEKYDKMLENSTVACCGTSLGNGLISFEDDRFGFQDRTCTECAKYHCFECTDEDGNNVLRFCHTCERNYCTACAAMVQCTANECEKFLCVDCAPHIACANSTCTDISCKECRTECNECKESWCYNCVDCGMCSKCYRACCIECSDKEGVNGVYWCQVCVDNLCNDCRVKGCQSGENNCEECVEIISRILLEENKRMQAQISSLKDENQKIKAQNKELGDENEELRQKITTIRMIVS